MKKTFLLFISLFILFSIIPVHAAEYPLSGPNIIIKMDSDEYPIYVTLLCETEYSFDGGHYLSSPHDWVYQDYDYYKNIKEKMKIEAAKDDYYFAETLVKITHKNTSLEWYGKTSSFKIMIYLPETDSFFISDPIKTSSSYLTQYHCTYHQTLTVSSFYSYSNLLLLSVLLLIGSLILRSVLLFAFKYHQSVCFFSFILETLFVSFVYFVLILFFTYFNGKISFVPISFILFCLLFPFELLYYRKHSKIRFSHFSYSFISNLLNFLLCFHLFNNYLR